VIQKVLSWDRADTGHVGELDSDDSLTPTAEVERLRLPLNTENRENSPIAFRHRHDRRYTDAVS